MIKNILTNCEVSSKTKLKDVCQSLYSQIINSKNPKRDFAATIESKADSVFSALVHPTSTSVEEGQDEELKPHISINRNNEDSDRSKTGDRSLKFQTLDSKIPDQKLIKITDDSILPNRN